MQPVDYKSKELNLYSNNGVGHLKFQDGKGTGLGPGFGQNQEYIFAKYTDSANGNMQWPVCIPELFTIDNSSGYVLNIGWTITDEQKKLVDEIARAGSAESKLTTDLAQEVADRKFAVSAEAYNRGAAIQSIREDLQTESTIRNNGDNANLQVISDLSAHVDVMEADSKTRDTALDGKLTVERTRALAAEGVVQANVDAEAKSRISEVKRLDGRIDFITNNSDGAAIDSLAEIVSQFSINGQTYANRLTYLEGIVSALVNKSQ